MRRTTPGTAAPRPFTMNAFRRTRISPSCLAAVVLCFATSGCRLYLDAIPATRLPPSLRVPSRDDAEPINYLTLRRDASAFKIGPTDWLAIWVTSSLEDLEGVDRREIPINLPRDRDEFYAATGFPQPVRADGTVTIPEVEAPIKVLGLSVAEAEKKIFDEINKSGRLKEGYFQVVVSLMRERRQKILVVRQDTNSEQNSYSRDSARDQRDAQLTGTGFRGFTQEVELPEGANDVLHALVETGGLPGLDAKNEIKILRGAFRDGEESNRIRTMLNQGLDPCGAYEKDYDDPTVVRIPLRIMEGEEPTHTEEDITLHTGDIVVIERRERDNYYTAGLLQGGEFPLPRDEDLDVLQAIAKAGGNSQGLDLGFSGVGGGTGGLVPPTWAIVVREIDGRQIMIKCDLRRALHDTRDRIKIQGNDHIILAYKPHEVVYNILLRNFSSNANFSFSRTLQ